MSAWDTILLHFPPPCTILKSVQDLETSSVALATGKPSNEGKQLVLCFYELHPSYVTECNISKKLLPKEKKLQQMGVLTTGSGCVCQRRCLLLCAAFNLFIWRVGAGLFIFFCATDS